MESKSHVPSHPVEVAQLFRQQFPKEFIFGSASSAYQYEGAAEEDGRKPSIWDTFCKIPGKIKGGDDGKDAVMFYHNYRKDVEIMRDMGFDAFRFSISWPRILPDGKQGIINQKGIDFYNNLLNELKAWKIVPFVTLFHWDVPQTLEDKFGGFRDRQIVEEFKYFADVCFEKFGDRVKHWITLNEPWSFSVGGYAEGFLAPGRCSPKMDENAKPDDEPNILMDTELVISNTQFMEINLDDYLPPCSFSPDPMTIEYYYLPPINTTLCSAVSSVEGEFTSNSAQGDSGVEPYLVGHHLLLAHAAAVKLYRQKYKKTQRGQIGITNLSILSVPYSEEECDKKAADRRNDFIFGWFMEPVINGDYPATMKKYVSHRLPTFTQDEEQSLKESFDFLGINYYTALFARDATEEYIKDEKYLLPHYTTDSRVKLSVKNCDGKSIGDQGSPSWLHIYPQGIKDTLLSVKTKYGVNDVPIYITENGIADDENIGRDDWKRKKYHHDHLYYVLQAIEEGINVKGYFAWSLLDNFEWHNGYSVRFGLNHVDYNSPRKERSQKVSSTWFEFLHKKFWC